MESKKERQNHKQRDKYSEIQKERKTKRQIEKDMFKNRGKYADICTERETKRQT